MSLHRVIGGLVPALLASTIGIVAPGQPPNLAAIEQLSKQGTTIPAPLAGDFPLREQRVQNDSGINVLIDLAHQASFAAMWKLPGLLRAEGFRASGSQATLGTVLEPGALSRVRIRAGGRRPFAWWPNAPWHVVFTFQGGPDSQVYLPEEVRALQKFVRGGGGLVIACGNQFDPQRIRQWSLNQMLNTFEAGLTGRADRADGMRVPTLQLTDSWEAVRLGNDGLPVVARRTWGRGRVVVFSSTELFFWNDRADEESPRATANRQKIIADAVRWAAGDTRGEATARLPREAAGGGPIYPELEQNVGGVIVYYAKNQKPELLATVRRDMIRAKELVEGWLPSTPPNEPMYLIVSAGGGGGWAVNAYLPKETGVISLQPAGLLSVFGHEIAHTMAGPPNDQGRVAAQWPHGNCGESHAGWFQGKINATFGDPASRMQSNRNCNRFFEFDKTGRELDLALEPAEMRDKWGKGKEWTKIWWVWQKLDDRYGPTWYPRWRWVQYTRWTGEPNKRLSWTETVEDMSIAVGEDLFPFFVKFGTTLDKARYPHATFQGAVLKLPVAPLEVTPAGPVCLEEIGDYTKPVRVRD